MPTFREIRATPEPIPPVTIPAPADVYERPAIAWFPSTLFAAPLATDKPVDTHPRAPAPAMRPIAIAPNDNPPIPVHDVAKARNVATPPSRKLQD